MAETIEFDLRAKSEKLQAELKKVSDRIQDLSQQASKVEIGSTQSQVFGKLLDANRQKARELTKELQLAKFDEKLLSNSQQFTAELGNAERGIDGISRKAFSLRDVLSTALGFSAANLAANAISALGGAFSSAIGATRSFGVEIAKINSTLPAGTRVTREQEDELIRLGNAYARTGSEQAAGFFEIISNGVEDSAVALDVLKASNDAALAGITSLDSSARVITTTLNAYASQGVTAAQITDSLVVATQLSGVKFEDLASSLGRVTAIASTSGISIGELSGTIAFLNKNSLTTEQAITGVRGIINAIIKPSEEATQIAQRLGLSFNSTALESKGLVQFLKEVSAATGNNSTTIARLFGDINAINSVVAISKGGFDSYADSVDKATNSQGAAAKAASELKTSLDFTIERQTAAISNLGLAFGRLLRPLITASAEALTGLTEAAASAFATKRPESFNTELERTNKVIDAIQSKNFFALQNLGIDKSVLTTAQFNKLLDDQLAKRDSLIAKIKEEQAARVAALGGPKEPEGGPGGAAPVDNANQAVLQRREQLNAELLALDQKTFFDQQALALEFEAAEAARKEESFLAQEDLELQRQTLAIEAAFQGEQLKNQTILDANAKALADKIAFNKKIAALDAAEQKRNIDASKRSLELAQATSQAEINIASSAVSLGAALAKEGDKTIFLASKAVGIAQAIVSTQVAAAKALALDPTGALSARVTAAGTLNVATIAATAIKGFENGGIVGGTNGATSGPDNRVATIRDGEMVLNAAQQERLLSMLNGGSAGSGDIVVQIDGREVVRAVRRQKQLGFAV